MNIWNTLKDLGMFELSDRSNIDGFNQTIAATFPEYVGPLLEKKYQLANIPVLALLRRWIIWWNWKHLARIQENEKICYSLLWYDEENEILKAVRTITWESINGILGDTTHYVLAKWQIYTAKKYYYTWYNL